MVLSIITEGRERREKIWSIASVEFFGSLNSIESTEFVEYYI